MFSAQCFLQATGKGGSEAVNMVRDHSHVIARYGFAFKFARQFAPNGGRLRGKIRNRLRAYEVDPPSVKARLVASPRQVGARNRSANVGRQSSTITCLSFAAHPVNKS